MTEPTAGTELTAGQVVAQHDLSDIHGNAVTIPGPGRVTHLQFRRFSGCPVCNVHLRSFTARHGELTAAGVAEVVVFHSSADTMLEYQGSLPFTAIADPERVLYTEFGVQRMSVRRMLHPRTLRTSIRALARERDLRAARGPGEEHDGLPADFLIGADGRLLAVKYGKFMDDHWSVDTVLRLARDPG